MSAQAISAFINDPSPSAPVARDLARRAVKVDAEAKRLLSQSGKGRVYRLSNPKRTHRASAPGAPPAVDLGLLRASIRWQLGTDARGLFAVVGTPLKKGLFLELGTRTMAARPFLRRALRKAAG
jgi:hypothetical protein